MAFFLVQPKGDEYRWYNLEYLKLNLTISADIAKLEALRTESENVFKISFHDTKNREHRIVEGQLISVHSKSVLMVKILKLAVEKRWTYEETMRALYKFSPSQRKRLLKEFASEE